MSRIRLLAAIMFTDIVGYTVLMGDDEQKAFELLDKNRKLQQSLINNFGGRWIKELGDGVLVSFSNAADAVHCAIAIQQGCKDIPGLSLRIGIHSGDVVFEDNDVFGDSVNIAARLQALAPVGGTWISEQVYKSIANYKDIDARSVGKEILKHVKEPVRVYEVRPKNHEAESSEPYLLPKDDPKAAHPKSIAVLPFINMSNDPEQEYFSDGMAEEIINSLNHLKDLKVAGRTSSFQFKGKNVDLRKVGEMLGVSTVLEGSVRKQGNRLRITAQLINVEDGFHLWSEKFDRNMDDIFAIQDEIALAITEQLKITLFEKDLEKIIKPATHSPEAYELYLKGKFYISRRGSSILTGLNYFKKAVFIDPNYALAYAGVSFASILLAAYNFVPGKQIMKDAKQAAETALQLDYSTSEGYGALGYYYSCLEVNWVLSKSNFLMAIKLNPKYVQARSIYGLHYLAWGEGKFKEAEEQGRIAIKIEPLSAIDHADLAWTLYTAARFDEALALAKTGIELDANSFLSHRLCGLCYTALKLHKEAIKALSYALKISNRHQHALTALIWAYCSDGSFEKARSLMNELEVRASTEYIAGTYAGISAAFLGDLNKAFCYLEKAYEDHDPMLTQLKYLPYAPAVLRNDPRYQKLLDRIGYPV